MTCELCGQVIAWPGDLIAVPVETGDEHHRLAMYHRDCWKARRNGHLNEAADTEESDVDD